MTNLQTALAELLSKANTGIDSAAEFLSDEIPEVIQQLLAWNLTYTLIQFIIGTACLICAFILAKRTMKHLQIERSFIDSDIITVILNIITSIGLLMFSLKLTNLIWLKIWLAPKVWLIEYAADLAK